MGRRSAGSGITINTRSDPLAFILPSIPSGEAANPRRSQLAVGAGAAVLLSVSWAYVIFMARGMENMDAVAGSLLMPAMIGWDGSDLLLVFFMWAVMMIAMMLPSVMPLLLLVTKFNHGRFA